MGMIYLDVSDVVEYFNYNMTASGIQRVQLEFIRVFAKDARYRFVIAGGQEQGFILVDQAPLEKMVAYVDAGDFSRADMDELLATIRSSRAVATAADGDVFFVSGAFWASSSTLRSLWAAKESGALVGFLCYDLIPIRQREFCDEGLVALFQQALESVCNIVDFIFTISHYVKKDVEAYLEQIDVSIPVIALPLAHELAAQKGPQEISERVDAITAQPFVLFVSTIEARKNHAYALTVWQRLLERIPDRVPNLVWVGRPGWLVDDLLKRVRRLDHLGGRLKIINNISDAELAALYRASLFSFYPSLSEGWGLPVAESLMAGKTAVVSKATSLPEVGGEFVTYIDPDNVTEGVEAVERLLLDPDLLQRAERTIAQSFKPRLWSDVCADLAKGFESLAKSHADRPPLPTVTLRPGLAYPAGGKEIEDGAEITIRQRSALDALFDANWYSAEAWGRWMKGTAGGLRLDVADSTGPSEYVVALNLQLFEGWNGKRVSIHCPATGREAIFRVSPGKPLTLSSTILLPAGRAQLVIRSDRDDSSGSRDPRRFSIGLVAFGFAPSSDPDAVRALMASLPSGDLLTGKAIDVGHASGLKPARKLLPTNDWRMKLVRRTFAEGPRLAIARALRFGARWISGGKVI